MKRKMLATLLTAALLATSLVGCGNQESVNDSEKTSNTAEASKDTAQPSKDTADAGEDNAEEELVEIVWQWPGNMNSEEGLREVEDAFNEMVKEIGVHVTFYQMTDWDNQLAMAISTGEQVDICMALGNVGAKAEDGMILPLDEYIEEHGSDMLEILGADIAGGYYNGSLYGVPQLYTTHNGYGFIANKEICDKYGFKAEEGKVYTIEEIEEMFAVIQEGEGEDFCCVYTNATNYDKMFYSMYPMDYFRGGSLGTGVLLFNESFDNTTIENFFETEEFESYAKMRYDWRQKGYIADDASVTDQGVADLVSTGKCLGEFRWVGESGIQEKVSAHGGIDVYAFSIVENYKASNMQGNIIWSVPVTSANPAKALETLNYIYKHDEATLLLQFGIEGRSYEVVESEEINGYTYKRISYLNSDTSALPYFQGLGIYGNRFHWFVTGAGAMDGYVQKQKAGEAVTNISPALEHCFVTTDVTTEIALINSVLGEYLPAIHCGSAEPDKILKEFRDALKNAGVDKVIEENQKQLDAVLKK